jgi:cytochrome c oxidase cbb3-type subunit II
MNQLKTFFVGFLTTFLLAWLGLVIVPYFQLGQLAPQVDEDAGMSYPLIRSGLAERGKQVYQQNGCISCHTQQLRPVDVVKESNRGWGARRSVARDYIYDQPVLLGESRVGPDLSNTGKRQVNGVQIDGAWLHTLLYAPRSVSLSSNMPSYRFLYKKHKIQGSPSPHAVKLPPELAPPYGFEIIPTPEAVALVAYLQSLDHTYALPEAPLPK